jgi:hemoglobin
MRTGVLASALSVMVSVTSGMAAPQKEVEGRSLYQRLGGYDTIAGVVNEFGRRFEEDPRLQPFLVGFSADTGRRQIQMFIEFLCAQTGGPCTYLGRDMTTAHAGMTISEAHWKAFMEDLSASFDALKVPPKEKAEALAIFTKLKPEIGIK